MTGRAAPTELPHLHTFRTTSNTFCSLFAVWKITSLLPFLAAISVISTSPLGSLCNHESKHDNVSRKDLELKAKMWFIFKFFHALHEAHTNNNQKPQTLRAATEDYLLPLTLLVTGSSGAGLTASFRKTLRLFKNKSSWRELSPTSCKSSSNKNKSNVKNVPFCSWWVNFCTFNTLQVQRFDFLFTSSKLKQRQSTSFSLTSLLDQEQICAFLLLWREILFLDLLILFQKDK